MERNKKKIKKLRKKELKELKILQWLLEEVPKEKDDEEIEKIEGELFPKIVEEVEEKIKREGINEKEVKKIMEELRKANFPRTEEELREDAIFIWKGELINKIFEVHLKIKKQQKKEIEKKGRKTDGVGIEKVDQKELERMTERLKKEIQKKISFPHRAVGFPLSSTKDEENDKNNVKMGGRERNRSKDKKRR